VNPMLDLMVKAHHLGVKSRRGFFAYDTKGKQGELEREALAKFGVTINDGSFPYDEVRDPLLAHRCALQFFIVLFPYLHVRQK